LTEDPKKRIVQRITRNFLDILKIRHGALYPLLNSLEVEGYARSEKTTKGGRVRKVYEITPKGIQLVDAYYDLLKEQLEKLDIKEA
jgi:DNA-binding PadR family transcriptional regulator